MNIVKTVTIYPAHEERRIKLICHICKKLTQCEPYHILSQSKRIFANVRVDEAFMIQLRISFSHVYPRLKLIFYGQRNSVDERNGYILALEVIRKQLTDEGVM